MSWKKGSMVSVKITKETHKRLQEHKEKTGVNITFTMEKAIEQYFRGLENKTDGREG